MAILGSENQLIRTVNTTERKETFSSRLVNFVEPNIIGGVAKTKFYTEVNTDLATDDKVFIINGNYCNSKQNEEYLYNKFATGYKILAVDRNAITLDIDYTAVLPKNVADFNDEEKFIKIYTVNNTREVDYYDYLIFNTEGESGGIPRFVYLPNATLKDIIYNNTGSTISSIYGSIPPNTFYSYNSSAPGDKFPVSTTEILTEINTNGKSLFAMESFDLISTAISNLDVKLEKGKTYIINSDNNIIIDVIYEDSFLSRSNFRFGNFKSGTWNDGIFGKKTSLLTDKKTYWEGSNWRNGIFYNSDWITGTMESKSDSITQQSFYGELVEFGIIKESTDFTNNKTFGYNYIFESDITQATIKNGNIYEATFGTGSSNSVREEFYLAGTNSSDINIENGLYVNSNFSYANITGGTFELSDIENSNLDSVKILDSNVDDSIITNSGYDGFGSIKIADYDKQFFRIEDAGLKRIGIIHKFYISDEDYLKVEEGDSISFNNLVTDHLGVETLFDKEYFIGVGLVANTNGFNHGYLDNNHEVIVDLRPKSKNEFKYQINSATSSFVIDKVSNDKLYNSIDLTFMVSYLEPTISGTYSTTDPIALQKNNYEFIYNDIIQKTEDYRSSVTIYEDAKMQISKLSNSVFSESKWSKGTKETNEDFIIKYDGPIGNFSPNISIFGTFGFYGLEIGLTHSDNRDLFDFNDLKDEIIQLNNITYTQGTQIFDFSGSYKIGKIKNISPNRIIFLYEYGTYSTLNIGLTFSGGIFSYHDTPFLSNSIFDLDIDKSTISGGKFRRQFFNNSTIFNKDINVLDKSLLTSNLNNLKIYRSLLSADDNLILSDSFLNQSVLTGVTVSNLLTYNSLVYDTKWNNGLLLGSHWDSGEFNDGVIDGLGSYLLDGLDEWFFDKSLHLFLSPTFEELSIWIDGVFNNGQFFDSVWKKGTFNDGKFYKSTWENGIFNNGEFGDKNINNSDTKFLQGTWNDGIFNKGEFGHTSAFPPVTTSIWNDGVFNDGIFGGSIFIIGNTPLGNTIWNNGTFNNGDFSGSARWKNGIFNSGKFRSVWGSGMGTASNYSWENGTFNNGEFGDIGATSGTTWNSTWYNGTFEGGLFRGKIWNDGFFTGGKFLGMTGNGASSSNYFYDEPMSAVQNPENFVMSFSSEVSNKNWYGLWRKGTVIDNITDLTNKIDTQFKDIRRFKGKKTPNIEFENVLWVDGTFSSTSGQMVNSVWLNGQFNRGQFINSNFNPYTPRWDFDDDGGATNSLNKGIYQYELTNSCKWNNGVLDNSEFSISEWESGNFLFGTMSGSLFKNGVSNYMNAYNVTWESGRWRNGNWYGSNFSFKDKFDLDGAQAFTEGQVLPFAPVPFTSTTYIDGQKPVVAIPGKDKDIFIQTALRHGGTNSAFVGSLFDVTFDGSTYSYLQDNTWDILFNGPGTSSLVTNSNGGNNKLTRFNGGFTYTGIKLNQGISNNPDVEFSNHEFFGYNEKMFITTKNQNLTGTIGTYSTIIDGVEVESKYGNGSFNKGTWENGVWNNGIRTEEFDNTEKTKLFDTVTFYQLSKDVWQIVLTGSDISDINSFAVGDDVSVGNIVLIDINDKRKLIKDKFKIISIDTDNNYLYLNIVVNFPIRKIERDSDRHKIKVTKNIWLSGLFLNGKFEGVWNNGYFKGYPCITEIIRSNWIDGTIDGGHFLADTATYSDSLTGTSSFATYSTGLIQNANILTNIEDTSDVQFSPTNRFLTYMDINYPVFYDNYLTPEEWRLSSVTLETGGVNGGVNPYIFGQSITYDVLSSLTKNLLKENVPFDFHFGVKFTEYDNILTDEISSFSGITNPGRLEGIGWSFSISISPLFKNPGGGPLSPTQTIFLGSDNDFTNPSPNGSSGLPLNQMNIDIGTNSNIKYFINHDNQSNIQKLRYTRIDIDIENLFGAGGTAGYIAPNPGFINNEGAAYVDLANKKNDTFKVSKFFFNREIESPLYGAGGAANFGLRVDNANCIEVDMIPFFDYAGVSSVNNLNINCDVQIPFVAKAPFIDYDDTDFSFINSVAFEFDGSVVLPKPSPPVILNNDTLL